MPCTPLLPRPARDARTGLIPLAADPAKQSAQVTRLLRRLHVHQLIAKIPHSRCWRVPLVGRRVMAAAVKLREVVYPGFYAYPASPVAHRALRICRDRDVAVLRASLPSRAAAMHATGMARDRRNVHKLPGILTLWCMANRRSKPSSGKGKWGQGLGKISVGLAFV